MVRACARRGHKLQTKWKGLMSNLEIKSRTHSVVDDINQSHRTTANAQRLIPCSALPQHQEVSKELQQQVAYHDKNETHSGRAYKGSQDWEELSSVSEMCERKRK